MSKNLRCCVIAGRVLFDYLRGVMRDLLSVWECVRSFVRYTGPRHIKDETEKVIVLDIVFHLMILLCVTLTCLVCCRCGR